MNDSADLDTAFYETLETVNEKFICDMENDSNKNLSKPPG